MSTKLLLADDSATIQRVIGLTFAGLDVEVIVAGDGDEAIARIAAERPDIVLADIGMPKRSGYDVSAFVKNHPELGRVPVVLLAGAFEPVDDVRAREARCDGVLVKPLEPQQVIATVHDLIDRARAASLPLRAPAPGAFDADAVLDSALDDYFQEIAQSSSGATLPDVALTPEIEAGAVKPELRLVADLSDPFLVVRMDRVGVAETPGVPEHPFPEAPTVMSTPLLEDLLSGNSLPDVGRAMMPIPVAVPAAPLHVVGPTSAHGVSAEPETEAVTRPKRSVVAEAFSAILAAENGERSATPLRFGPIGASPVVTDAMVDDLARRVLERLSRGSSEHVDAVVRRVMSEVAERLVREEIDRMRDSRQPATGRRQ